MLPLLVLLSCFHWNIPEIRVFHGPVAEKMTSTEAGTGDLLARSADADDRRSAADGTGDLVDGDVLVH